MKTHFPASHIRIDFQGEGLPSNRDSWRTMVKRQTACWMDSADVPMTTDQSAVTCKRCRAQIKKRGVPEVAA